MSAPTCEACGVRPADVTTATGWRLCSTCYEPLPRHGHAEADRLADERYADAMRWFAESLEREGLL